MIKRGEIYTINIASSKGKKVSALICSSDLINETSGNVIIAPIATKLGTIYSFEYVIKDYGKVMCDQIRVVPISQVNEKVFSLSMRDMKQIDMILKIILGIS